MERRSITPSRTPESPATMVIYDLEGSNRQLLAVLPSSYDDAVAAVTADFDLCSTNCVKIVVDPSKLGISGSTGSLEIARSSWDNIIAMLRLRLGNPIFLGVRATGASVPRDFVVSVKTLAGKTIKISTHSHASVLDLKRAIQDQEGIPPDYTRLSFAQRQLEDSQPLHAYGIQHESTIIWASKLRGGKPVIYLFSPTPLHASIRLRLPNQWKFACVYPVVPVESVKGGQEVAWRIHVDDSVLVDLATGNKEAYLFWEALADRRIDSPPASRPSSPSTCAAPVAFDPSRPILDPMNSAVINIEDIPGYLQKALEAMTLHVEARTSFITIGSRH